MKTFFPFTITKFTFVVCFVFVATIARSQCTVVTPGLVTGIKNVCPYIGTPDQLTYSIDPLTDATSYEWLIPPSNITLISGQGTTSITVTFQNGYQLQANKQLRVRAIFPCGTSSYRIFYTLTQFPGMPTNLVPGTTNLCEFVGTGNAVSYTIPSVLGATSYAWTAPPNAIIVGHPAGQGLNDTTILVTYQTGFTSGIISVQSVNDCGVSPARSLPVSTTVPGTPGLINGVTNVCSAMAPSTTALTYSIQPVVGAISYSWTFPPGCTVTHPNGTGANDFSVQALFPAGFTGGTISVTSTTGCGTSLPRILVVNRLLPSAPGGITVTELSGCPDRVYSYSLAALPLNGTSLVWGVPAGGTIVNGQNTTTLIVSYGAVAVDGVISATGLSNCGTGVPRTVPVHLQQCAGPRQSEQSIARNSTIMQQGSEMRLQISPNPSVGDFKLKLSTSENTGISIRILDVFGRTLKTINAKPNEIISFGNELKPGSYFIEMTQGNARKIERLVKL